LWIALLLLRTLLPKRRWLHSKAVHHEGPTGGLEGVLTLEVTNATRGRVDGHDFASRFSIFDIEPYRRDFLVHD
jgi:hypothetical protein